MDVRDLGQGKLSKTDQKKLQQDIKTLTKKVTAADCQYDIRHVAQTVRQPACLPALHTQGP